MAKKARPCVICKSKDRKKIERMIRRGEKLMEIKRQYKFDQKTILKHKKICMENHGFLPEKETPVIPAKEMAKSLREGQSIAGNVATAIDANFSLDEWIQKMRKLHRYADTMLEAINDYLIDPDDPTQYFIGARSDDVEVLYLEKDSDSGRVTSRQPRKATLTYLLGTLEDSGSYQVQHTNINYADPRKLLLDFIKVIGNLNKELVEMRNKDIEWILKSEEIRIKREQLNKDTVNSMSPAEQVKKVAEIVAGKMAENQDKNKMLMAKTGMPGYEKPEEGEIPIDIIEGRK